MSYPVPQASPGGMDFRQAAKAKVVAPGIALTVAGGLTIAGGLGNFLLGVLAATPNDIPDEAKGFGVLFWWFFGFVSVVLGGIILVGGIKMQSLRTYGLALTGSILSMLPCHGCCMIGLPIGIWSLVVLLQPDVKQAFE